VSVAEKTQKVQSLFSESSRLLSHYSSLQILDAAKGEYTSVVFEAIAADFAKKDIQAARKNLDTWNAFREQYKDKHGSQLHVGLGWALGETGCHPYDYIVDLSPLWRWRVLDGVGYYHGLFKRRETVRKRLVPEFIQTEEDLAAFDQGVGRSFWYISQGNNERLERLLTLFDENRQTSFWRGIGVASAYVGGLDENAIKDLITFSQTHRSQLTSGAIMAQASRIKSESLSSDSQLMEVVLGYDPKLVLEIFNNDVENYLHLLKTIENLV